MKTIVRTYRIIIVSLFMCILCALLALSFVSTSEITYAAQGEKTIFLSDSILFNLVIVLLVIFLIRWIAKRPGVQRTLRVFDEDRHLFHTCVFILLLFSASSALVWIGSLRAVPGADQLIIMQVADEIRHGDLSAMAAGGYLSMYPHQIGIVLALIPAGALLGDLNWLAFQALNVPALLLIEYALMRMARLRGTGHFQTLCLGILCLLFAPLGMYVTFVYGNMWGLALSLLAYVHAVIFFQKGKAWHLFLSGLLIGLAFFLKSNYIIFGIALALTGLFEAVHQKKGRPLLVSLLTVLSTSLFLFSSDIAFHSMTGHGSDSAIPKTAWIAMGTAENTLRADGWYDAGAITGLYRDAQGDPLLMEEISSRKLKENLEGFREDPGRLFDLLLNKTASQWNNPTFQGLWIAQVHPHAETIFLTDRSEDFFYAVLNGMMPVIQAGALLCFLKKRHQMTPADLLPALTVIGGFTFHLFWEAKCQYTLPYFVLLFPYTVKGYASLAQDRCRSFRREGRILLVPLIIALITVILPGYAPRFEKIRNGHMSERTEQMYPDGVRFHTGGKQG